MAPATILFVCTGNICRSPLAEAAARLALITHFGVPDLGTIGLRTASAGTHAMTGQSATSESQTVAAEFGLDLSEHRATQLDRGALAGASLVLAMENGQVDWIRSQVSHVPVGLLGNAIIEDPYGSAISEYRRAGREIVEAVQRRLSEMIALAD